MSAITCVHFESIATFFPETQLAKKRSFGTQFTGYIYSAHLAFLIVHFTHISIFKNGNFGRLIIQNHTHLIDSSKLIIYWYIIVHIYIHNKLFNEKNIMFRLGKIDILFCPQYRWTIIGLNILYSMSVCAVSNGRVLGKVCKIGI